MQVSPPRWAGAPTGSHGAPHSSAWRRPAAVAGALGPAGGNLEIGLKLVEADSVFQPTSATTTLLYDLAQRAKPPCSGVCKLLAGPRWVATMDVNLSNEGPLEAKFGSPAAGGRQRASIEASTPYFRATQSASFGSPPPTTGRKKKLLQKSGNKSGRRRMDRPRSESQFRARCRAPRFSASSRIATQAVPALESRSPETDLAVPARARPREGQRPALAWRRWGGSRRSPRGKKNRHDRKRPRPAIFSFGTTT